MDWSQRIDNYERATSLPRSLFVSGNGQVVGTWVMGSDYTSTPESWPSGYLKRIQSLFPERRRVLVYDGQQSPELLSSHDLILVQPTTRSKIGRNRSMRVLGENLSSGTFVAWLDHTLPMFRKDQFQVDAVIGVVRATNHRFRVVTVFRKI